MNDDPTTPVRDRSALRADAPARRRGFSWALAAPLIGIVFIVAALFFAYTSGVFSPAVPVALPTSEPAPQITETPAPPAPPSTRESPAPANTTLAIESDGTALYDVTFGSATLEASSVIRAATRYYRDADPGFQYLLVPVRFTYLGTTSGTPRIDLKLSYLATTGETYEGTSSAVFTPTPIENIVKMQPGDSHVAEIVIMVPSKKVGAGSIIVTAPDGTEYVVALQ